MMAEKKRQCGTCRFFVKKDASGRGKCTHPKRAGTDADLLLLRPSELACRTRWGDSLWQDPSDDSDPMKPQSPQQPSLPEPIAAQLQFDDEVTSVSIAGSKTSRSSFEDDVVDSGATASGMASWNDPVQDERLDLLRRGSHDALAGARKRHMEKQARQRDLIPFADDDEAGETDPIPAPTHQAAPVASPKPSFPPDDFVEDERTTSSDDSSGDDALVDDGFAPDQNRSPRLRKLLREPRDPKRNEAVRRSMPSDMHVTSNNPEQREQWNSVPTLNPGFELPLSKVAAEHTAPPVAASAAPMATSTGQPRSVSQARERLTEDRLRHERSQRRMVVPLKEEQPAQQESVSAMSLTDRPRLTEAPSENSAPLDTLRSSPLRGYHPATRKLVQQQDQMHERAPQKTTHRQSTQPRNRSQESERIQATDAHAISSPIRRTQSIAQAQPGQSTAPVQREQPKLQQRQATAPIQQAQSRPQQRQATAPVQQAQSRPQQRQAPAPVQQAQSRPQQRQAAAPAQQVQSRPQQRQATAPVQREQPKLQQRQTTAPVQREQTILQQRQAPKRHDEYRDEEQRARPYIPLHQTSTPFVYEEIEIAPHVPKRCGTCASYRRSDVEGRGSCANAFAGPVQRVVYEQDLACMHTYGSLWLPADERVWLKELEDHSAPTPRVDAMLARRQRKVSTVLPDIEELTS